MRLRVVRFVLVLAAGLTVACASRYRLDLYIVAENTRKRVAVERAELLRGQVLGDPLSEYAVLQGAGNLLLMETGTRWRTVLRESPEVFGFDEYLRCRLYVQLAPDTLLQRVHIRRDNAFAQVLGRYDLPRSRRTYLGDTGIVTLDSLAAGALYGTMEAVFRNDVGDSLVFSGRFRVVRY